MASVEKTNTTSNKKPLSNVSNLTIQLFAGGAGGMLGAIATQPLDVLKTRLQASTTVSAVAKGQKEAPFTKTFNSLKYTYQLEGIRGWYRGLTPILIGIVPNRAIYFATYAESKSFLGKHIPAYPTLVHMASAACAVISVSSLMNPLFLLKTRMQLQESNAANKATNHYQYKGYFDCARKIYQDEGIRGFYRGLTASWLGITETAFYFVLYEKVKHFFARKKYDTYISNHKGENSPILLEQYQKVCFSPLDILVMSASCKLLASAATYPHEVLKTRMRELDSNGKGKYRSLYHCFSSILKERGIRGAYSGMSVHLLRVVPTTAIMFGVYEFIVAMFEKYKSS